MADLRILCASPLVREGVRRLLDIYDLHCAEASLVSPIVLLIATDDEHDRNALARVQRDGLAPRTLVLNLSLPEAFARECLAARAAGVLASGCSRLDLIDALRRIAEGRQGIAAPPPQRLRLSAREAEVMRGIRMGKTTKALAHELNISEKTISTYRRRVLDKLGLSTNADLILQRAHPSNAQNRT